MSEEVFYVIHKTYGSGKANLIKYNSLQDLENAIKHGKYEDKMRTPGYSKLSTQVEDWSSNEFMIIKGTELFLEKKFVFSEGEEI